MPELFGKNPEERNVTDEQKVSEEEVLGFGNKTMMEVEPIHRSPSLIFTRESIKEYVESPLVAACEHLYDKNIQTVNSSANKENIRLGYAFILIDFENLSEENKKIGMQLGELYADDKRLELKIPVQAADSEKEFSARAVGVVESFKKQQMTWATYYPIEELREIHGMDPSNEAMDINKFTSMGYYYDPERKLFFMNEEQFKKASEIIEE